MAKNTAKKSNKTTTIGTTAGKKSNKTDKTKTVKNIEISSSNKSNSSDLSLSEVPVFEELLKYESGVKHTGGKQHDKKIPGDKVPDNIKRITTIDSNVLKHGFQSANNSRHSISGHPVSSQSRKQHISNHPHTSARSARPSQYTEGTKWLITGLIVLIIIGVFAVGFLFSIPNTKYIDDGICNLKITTIVKGDKSGQYVEIPGSKCHTDSECIKLLSSMNFNKETLDSSKVSCLKVK